MTLSHLRFTLLSANAKRYSLCSSVKSSFTAACRHLHFTDSICFVEGFWLPINSGLVTVLLRTGQFTAEYRQNWLLHLQRMPQRLWNHTTTDHKEGEQLEDRRSVGASSCNSVHGTGQRVQSLIFMITMMVVIPYPPFSTMASSRYSVPSTVLKLWITIMQFWKTFPSFGRKLKEN